MDRASYSAGYSLLGAPISLRNFRREYDDDDDGYGLAAAAFPALGSDPDQDPDTDRVGGAGALQDDASVPDDSDSDGDSADQRGRKRKFRSTSSSCPSLHRSPQLSVSPPSSLCNPPDLRDGLERAPANRRDGREGAPARHRDYVEEALAYSSSTGERSGNAEEERPAGRDRYRHSQLREGGKSVCLFTSDDDDDDYYEDEGWKDLPVILLEDIFVLLTPKQRHLASMVCRPWYEIFYSPRVWETFILFETTLTRRRFNAYKGYQRELCPGKTQLCLMRVGCFFKRIVVTPISDYYSLYEFLRVLAAFLALHADEDFPMPLLHTFRFTFACESRGMNGVVIIGTGGNILRKVKDLVSSMQQLRHLALNQLLLDEEEVPGLLAAAATHCSSSLLSLELLNCSKVPLPICEVTQFSHLIKLKLSAQHLSEEVVLLLGGTQLLQLHILQDAYTCTCQPVPSEAWKVFRDMAPAKRVFLEVQGRTKAPLLLQPHAPVRGVIFRTPYHRLTPDLATWLLHYYGACLEYFVQERLPRVHGSRRFSERADESFLRLVRACPRLHTLVIRERISLATLLLLAQEAKCLRSFIVRRNALLKKCEWPRASSWSPDFHRWLRRHGRDYELAFRQVPLLLGQRWKPSEDRAFKHLMIQVT